MAPACEARKVYILLVDLKVQTVPVASNDLTTALPRGKQSGPRPEDAKQPYYQRFCDPGNGSDRSQSGNLLRPPCDVPVRA